MIQPFDFDTIGKRTPYRTPDGFFETMQHEVMTQVEPPRRHRRLVVRISSVVVGVAAAVSALVFLPRAQSDAPTPTIKATSSLAETSWIESLSDDELEALDHLIDYDIFMN